MNRESNTRCSLCGDELLKGEYMICEYCERNRCARDKDDEMGYTKTDLVVVSILCFLMGGMLGFMALS